jgi:DNA-binding MarR family transcriptional regulator
MVRVLFFNLFGPLPNVKWFTLERKFLTERCCPSRITQYSILNELARHETPPTMGELAKALVMERSALGQTLRPLERDGLIEFRRDAADGRRRPVFLTDAGREAMAKAEPFWRRAQDAFVSSFGVEQSAALRETLNGIANSNQIAADDR